LIVAFMPLHKFSLVMMSASIESCEFKFWFLFKGLEVGKTVCKLGKLLYIEKTSQAVSFSPQNNWLSPLPFFPIVQPSQPLFHFTNEWPSWLCSFLPKRPTIAVSARPAPYRSPIWISPITPYLDKTL
jgi:hypothetical protein